MMLTTWIRDSRRKAQQRRQQLQEDRQMAVQLQRELRQQRREEQVKEHRKRRQSWYEQFLPPYTMIAEDKDFIMKPSDDVDNPEAETCFVKVPKKNCMDENYLVEGSCAVCMLDYEPGDAIVWSSTDKNCSHVFHKECIMTWLVRGKKRCPICRVWFVPPTKIADQEKALRERQEAEESSGGEDTTDSSDDRGSFRDEDSSDDSLVRRCR